MRDTNIVFDVKPEEYTGELKKWKDDDKKELSLKRDLWATAKLCEMVGLCSYEEAEKGFKEPFEQLAAMGYSGYCFYDFGGVSLETLAGLYRKIVKANCEDPKDIAVSVWEWPDYSMKAWNPGCKGQVKILLRNADDDDYAYKAGVQETDFGRDTMFGLGWQYDSRFGFKEEYTQLHLMDVISKKFEADNAGYQTNACSAKDHTIIFLMDLLDELYPQPEFSELHERYCQSRAYRDLTTEWKDLNLDRHLRTGRVWYYPSPSLGYGGDCGALDANRVGFAVYGKKIQPEELPFIKEWTPGRVKSFKSLESDEVKDEKVKRDLWATAKIYELAGFGTLEEGLKKFESSFNEIAGLGYAGACFYDFANMTAQELIDLTEKVYRNDYVHDPEYPTIFYWNDMSPVLNTRKPAEEAKVKFLVYNAQEESVKRHHGFGPCMQPDTIFGEDVELTQLYLLDKLTTEFGAVHDGYSAYCLSFKDAAVLKLMDLVTEIWQPDVFKKYGKRVANSVPTRDLSAGRCLPPETEGYVMMYPRYWTNPNGTIGMSGEPGHPERREPFAMCYGSFAGALKLSMQGIGVIGIPGTIDLDIGCTDYTIGFDTAVNTSIEAIDRISDTCKSHSCFCVVEVMGRRAGFIALWSGIGNAAQVIWADNHMTLEKITHYLKEKNITSGVIVMAEGVGKAERVATYIEEKIHVHTRANVLAFIQRGGSPTGKDRVVGCMMGSYAVDLFTEGKIQHLVCIKKDELSAVTIKEGLQMEKKDPVYLYNLSKTVMKL